eukprot:m.15153 g.15153  ORF g.15153 m.15153 type:complete len:60 (+) comp4420_c0_seq1:517-696(+)
MEKERGGLVVFLEGAEFWMRSLCLSFLSFVFFFLLYFTTSFSPTTIAYVYIAANDHSTS